MDLKPNLGVTKNGHLSLHGVDIVDLSKKYGTPLFVFDEERIKQNYLRFHRAFETHYPNTISCYSTKTNSNLAVCRVLQQVGAHAEVCSELDFYTAIKAGFDPNHIVLDGPYKPEKLIREALKQRIFLINAESTHELERINRIAGELGVKQNIGIRVNFFNSRTFSAQAVYCNLGSRFGFSTREAYAILEQASKFSNLQINGLMTHPFYEFSNLISFMKLAHQDLGIQFEYLNFGGGFDQGTAPSFSYRDLLKDYVKQRIGFRSGLDKKYSATSIEQIGESITNAIKQSGVTSEPTIVLEPGRFIISDAGYLVLRVDHIKKAGGHVWVTVDGGTNLLPITSERREIRLLDRPDKPHNMLVNIVGPIPSLTDIISLKKHLPKIQEGDLLLVFDAGAYSVSSSNQFLYPRPCIIMLDPEKGVKKIREGETFEDVMRLDNLE